MNDADEDAEAERRLQHRMESAGSTTPPSPALLAPAALYLTAILECVFPSVTPHGSRSNVGAAPPLATGLYASTSSAFVPAHYLPLYSPAVVPRHVLSNVSRVASRDSGRTHATVQDLFIALGEDDTIYTMFKTMKGAYCFRQAYTRPSCCRRRGAARHGIGGGVSRAKFLLYPH